MDYGAFYTCARSDLSVGEAAGVRVTASGAEVLARTVLLDSQDFFGLVDAAGQVLQFYREPDGRVWVDLPMPAERASYGRHVALADLPALLRELPDAFTRDGFGDLERQEW